MEKRLQKPYLTNYHLLIAQDFLQAHYQILLMIQLKKFIKLNVNTDMLTENAKRVKLNTKNIQALKMI